MSGDMIGMDARLPLCLPISDSRKFCDKSLCHSVNCFTVSWQSWQRLQWYDWDTGWCLGHDLNLCQGRLSLWPPLNSTRLGITHPDSKAWLGSPTLKTPLSKIRFDPSLSAFWEVMLNLGCQNPRADLKSPGFPVPTLNRWQGGEAEFPSEWEHLPYLGEKELSAGPGNTPLG